MGFLSDDKPHTAVTVSIEHLTGEQYELDDLDGIFELIENVRLAPTGPSEAARAIRKRLKHGTPHNQLRALTLLDALIENGGKRFQSNFCDPDLLDRIKITATSSQVNPKVRKKALILLKAWSTAYARTPGMQGLVSLYGELPRRTVTKPATASPRQARDSEDDEEDDDDDDGYVRRRPADDERSTTRTRHANREEQPQRRHHHHHSRQTQNGDVGREVRPTTSSSSGGSNGAAYKKKTKAEKRDAAQRAARARAAQRLPHFNLNKERPRMLQVMAEATTASTNLKNALTRLDRDQELASENDTVMNAFQRCRTLRRQVLKYIQLVESEDYLGSLIHANEELVDGLKTFDRMNRPPGETGSEDSGSEPEPYSDDEAEDYAQDSDEYSRLGHNGRSRPESFSESDEDERELRSSLGKVRINKKAPPPIPPPSTKPIANATAKPALTRSDSGNPFADDNVIF